MLDQISWVLKSYDNILNILFSEDENDEPDEGEPGEPSKSLGNANQCCNQTVRE